MDISTNAYMLRIAHNFKKQASKADAGGAVGSDSPSKANSSKTKPVVSNPNSLKPHQERALEKLRLNKSVILDHFMGSGKTKTFLTAAERALKSNKTGRVLVIAPASLQNNVSDEIKKHGLDIDMSRLDVRSYEKAVNDSNDLKKNKYILAIADEAHRLRSTNTLRHKELSELIMKADSRLLATGTTAYNHVSDIAPLVNIAAGGKVLPEGKKAFEDSFVNKHVEQPPFLKRILGAPAKEVHHLKNKKQLGETLRKYIDNYDVQDDEKAKGKFPTRTDKVVEVDMSPEQKSLYKYMENELPFHLKLKVRMNLPLDKRDTASLQAFSSGIRQVSNSLKPFMPNYTSSTPKMITAAESMHQAIKGNKKFRGVAYSNYLGAGLDEYSSELTKRGIKHEMYHGGLTSTQKSEMVDRYNAGKIPVLVISSSGAEGLNLKGTRKMQILEPHFNASKISQIAARGVRYESHDHLPKEERNVEVEHYLSTFPKSKFSIGPKQHSIDQYLHQNSKTKSQLSDEMKELVKQAFVKSKSKRVVSSEIIKKAFSTVDYTFDRAKYHDSLPWDKLENPVGSIKRDGAAYFLVVDPNGNPSYYSRRESVKGGYPDRSEKLTHLSDKKLPDHAGEVYHVELHHTGHDLSDMAKDSHPAVSGILNSLPERALETQRITGPVRATLLDVISPKLNTYSEKLDHINKLVKAYGKPEVLRAPYTKIGKIEIQQLIADTKARGDEGVIVTSLTTPEDSNVRIKIKHVDTYNLRIVDVIQEVDKLGAPKNSMGALVLADRSGRVVCNVGTGFSKEQRANIWKNRNMEIGNIVQVKAMPSTGHRLRSPVYNGYADGKIDLVSSWPNKI